MTCELTAPTLLLWVRFWKSAIIQSFNKHGLGICLVPGLIIGPGDRDLRTCIAPWPQGVHTQQGFTDRLQYGTVQGPLSQARGGQNSGPGKASHRGRCLIRAVKEEKEEGHLKSGFSPGNPGQAGLDDMPFLHYGCISSVLGSLPDLAPPCLPRQVCAILYLW